jgi:hypothetical protein
MQLSARIRFAASVSGFVSLALLVLLVLITPLGGPGI